MYDYALNLLLTIVVLAQTITPVYTPPVVIDQQIALPPIQTPVIAPQQATEPVAVEVEPVTEPIKKECSCVMYIRSKGIPMPRLIDAKNFDITLNSPPFKGGLVKMKYGEVYHLAYVESISADGINISEQNYSKDPTCPVTYRKLDFSDPTILGFARSGYPME